METRNFVVEFKTWDSYNVKTKEEAIEQCKRDNGDNIEIIDVVD